jgi:hypothetical protein
MTSVTIELPDDRAEALKAKAAEQGLTLEGWFQKMAERQDATQIRYSLSELIDQCDTRVPLSDEERAWLDIPPVGREAV